ncbi:Asp-tRNA(Asn)/Glu-tRNA(Gln) amidotransferase GatCAB subunit A [Candidatus Gracilibacteria bacterium CG17_big_fil_post_rev_8_21_14_2_50_48_13]|nr:MAG: Asp-tRNA(Asn)/Glu-tRNA(Gln) amidotransferase GatCAB subunit A [Candidatus Gracilibacteria bacterium CG17_big_fil_post_rev_8_21_14_2_50_48_13]
MSKITEIHALIQAGKSIADIVSAYLEKAEKAQERLNCYTYIAKEEAMAAAKAADERLARGEAMRPLEGIPCSIKDVLCTAGLPSTAASKMLSGFTPTYNATVVQKLLDAGAIIIAKNNCDEFAMGGSNENSAYGPARNPHNTELVPGGSSGGSAAAVAADACVFSIGTDTGGSIRQPAAFCGCVGLKVTYGRTSRRGAMAMASSFDTVGPLAQTVEDIAFIMEVIAGKDAGDSTTLHADVPNYKQHLTGDLTGMRFGLPAEYFGDDLAPEIKAQIDLAIEQIRSLGGEVQPVQLPMTKYALAVYYITVSAEVTANMSRYDGLRFGPSTTTPKDLDDLYTTNREAFGEEVQRRIILGNFVLSHGYYDAYYKRAQQVRTLIREDFDRVFTEVDILITPVTPTLPFPIGSKQDPLAMYMGDVFTLPASAAGIPGLAVPIGVVDGLPVGMQLLGKQLSEADLLKVGHLLTKQP